MISTTALRYFTESVRCGSIRAASERLFVAPSAIGRQITLLEEELGAPLLERSRGRAALKLTAAGELLMRYAKSMSSEQRRLQSEIEAILGLRRGHINLGMPESLVRDFMPRFLAQFKERYPGFTFNVQVFNSPRLIEMLVDDQVDLCLTFGNVTHQDASIVYSRSLPLYVYVAAGHPLHERETLRLSDCAEYGLALPDPTMWTKQQYDEMLTKAKIRPKVALETNSYELLRNVAAEGMALSILTLPLQDTLSSPKAGRYVPLKDPRVKMQRFSLSMHRGRNLPLPVSTFMRELTTALEHLEDAAPRGER